MCTLTYLLTETGYELFFNRDEQLSRTLAIPPKLHQVEQTIYPIDPEGNGTWIAIDKNGCSLVLLNYYQATNNDKNKTYISRGQIILSLLKNNNPTIEGLNDLDLNQYQAFQLCLFADNLSLNNSTVQSVIWNGTKLIYSDIDLPITSSSINYCQVKQKRQSKFNQLIDSERPTSEQLKEFHYSKESLEQYSVNMLREDARTVSISHIVINKNITFEYFDNILNKSYIINKKRH